MKRKSKNISEPCWDSFTISNIISVKICQLPFDKDWVDILPYSVAFIFIANLVVSKYYNLMTSQDPTLTNWYGISCSKFSEEEFNVVENGYFCIPNRYAVVGGNKKATNP